MPGTKALCLYVFFVCSVGFFVCEGTGAKGKGKGKGHDELKITYLKGKGKGKGGKGGRDPPPGPSPPEDPVADGLAKTKQAHKATINYCSNILELIKPIRPCP